MSLDCPYAARGAFTAACSPPAWLGAGPLPEAKPEDVGVSSQRLSG
jgi:hypothetical protein